SAATVTGLATPPLPARHLIRPALSVPTPIPAALTDARTPLVRRWEMSRASQIAVLPPLYVAPTATALTPPSTRIAHPALPPSVTLPPPPPSPTPRPDLQRARLHSNSLGRR